MILDQKYYLSADGSKAVPEGDPEANSLLGQAGDEICDCLAKSVGLLKKSQAIDEAPNNKAVKPESKEAPKE